MILTGSHVLEFSKTLDDKTLELLFVAATPDVAEFVGQVAAKEK